MNDLKACQHGYRVAFATAQEWVNRPGRIVANAAESASLDVESVIEIDRIG